MTINPEFQYLAYLTLLNKKKVLIGITSAPSQIFAHLVKVDGQNKKGIKMAWML
jgi:hypothetical protein